MAPDRRRLLAQWSGECEVPTAFLVDGSRVRSFGRSSTGSVPESGALGWLRDGSAVIHFPVGACGGSIHTPGAYVVPRSSKAATRRRHGQAHLRGDVGRLALLLLFGRAGVDRAVEVVPRELALDVCT